MQRLMENVLNPLSRTINSLKRSREVFSHPAIQELTTAAASAARALMALFAAGGRPLHLPYVQLLDGLVSIVQQDENLGVQYDAAREQIAIALVHGMHAVRTEDLEVAAQLDKLMRCRIFGPILMSSNKTPATTGNVLLVTALLRMLRAVLNAFESYADKAQDQQNPASLTTCAHGQLRKALETCVSILTGLEAYGYTADAALREAHADCLTSCMRLAPARMRVELPKILPAIQRALPYGGIALSRCICCAVEVVAVDGPSQAQVSSAIAATLCSESAQTLLTFRGADAAPDIAVPYLTVATCLLQQARRWTDLSSSSGSVLQCLQVALQLAAANVACSHKGVAQRSLTALSAALRLALDTSCSMYASALEVAGQQGGVVLSGLFLSLISLNSPSFLPKIVGLVGDVAMLAVASSVAPSVHPRVSFEYVAAAALQLLQAWTGTARQHLTACNAMAAGIINGMTTWDWTPVLEEAVHHRFNGGSSASAEAHRRMQRITRQLVDAVRRSCGAAT